MDIDIDNIDKYEIKNKVNTVKWRPIYEVIEEFYFKSSEIFHMILYNNSRIMQMKLNFSRLR